MPPEDVCHYGFEIHPGFTAHLLAKQARNGLISSHPVPSRPIPSHPVPSRPIPSHPVPSRPVPSFSLPFPPSVST